MNKKIFYYLFLLFTLGGTSSFAQNIGNLRAEDFGYNVRSMRGVIPLLTILIEFRDAPFDRHHTPEFYEELLFGSARVRANIVGIDSYFSQNSNRRFRLSNAGIRGPFVNTDDPESACVMTPDSEGMPREFCIDESTIACGLRREGNPFAENPTQRGCQVDCEVEGNCGRLGISRLMRKALQRAERDGFDFDRYDTNNNGLIEKTELQLLFIRSSDTSSGAGGNRSLDQDFITRRGKRIRGGVPIVTESTGTTLIMHELAHYIGIFWEGYGPWGTGLCVNSRYSVMSCSSGAADSRDSFHLDPLSKMQLGWVRPEIIPFNAQRNLRIRGAATPEEANKLYLIYDPAKGTREFYLLEHRYKSNENAAANINYDGDPWEVGAPVMPDEGLGTWGILLNEDFSPRRLEYNNLIPDGFKALFSNRSIDGDYSLIPAPIRHWSDNTVDEIGESAEDFVRGELLGYINTVRRDNYRVPLYHWHHRSENFDIFTTHDFRVIENEELSLFSFNEALENFSRALSRRQFIPYDSEDFDLIKTVGYLTPYQADQLAPAQKTLLALWYHGSWAHPFRSDYWPNEEEIFHRVRNEERFYSFLPLGYLNSFQVSGPIRAFYLRSPETQVVRGNMNRNGLWSEEEGLGILKWYDGNQAFSFRVLSEDVSSSEIQVALNPDTDRDGTADVEDRDDDNDGIRDFEDNCPFVINRTQEDNEGDGRGDVCDPDDDNDGLRDPSDNCPLISNVNQQDFDRDGMGNVCDEDDDNDGIPDVIEEVLGTNPLNSDTDNDGTSDFEEFESCSLTSNHNEKITPLYLGFILLLVLLGAIRFSLFARKK